MRFLKRLLDFYIESSLHIGVAVMSLVVITFLSNCLPLNSNYIQCTFYGTVLGYNFLKYFVYFRKNKGSKKIILITFLFSVLFLIDFLKLELVIQIPIIVSGMIVLVYPFLRKFGWLKMFLVSFVVTIVTVYIPYQSNKIELFDFNINLIQRFLFITSLMIPFEIYDSKTDAQSMNTLPQLFGIRRAKLFGMLILIPFLILEFLKVNFSFSVIPIGMLTLLFIHFTTLNRDKYYTSFWVESIPIVWLLFLLIFKLNI